MNIVDISVITFFSLISIISGILCSIICRYISEKPLVEQTILDLIYKDFITYIQLLTPITSIAVSSCLITAENVLEFSLGLFFSTITFFIVNCAAISILIGSFLRLLSILKNSEAAGIQLLGQDDRAIVYIRISSFLITSLKIFMALVLFNCVPPAMMILVTNQTISLSKLMKDNPAYILYFLSLPCAIILTISANVVRRFEFFLLLVLLQSTFLEIELQYKIFN
jgi:hypothetical protein